MMIDAMPDLDDAPKAGDVPWLRTGRPAEKPKRSAGNDALLHRARALRDANISVIPISPDGSKRPPNEWAIYSTGPKDKKGNPLKDANGDVISPRLATDAELLTWYGNGKKYGMGAVGGKISGNLEHLDFDHDAVENYQRWCMLVEERYPGLLDLLSHRITPGGGFHVSWRCAAVTIPGNMKVAQKRIETPNGDDVEIDGRTYKPKQDGDRWFVTVCMVETRGEGGMVLIPGCPPECHPTGGLYQDHRGVGLEAVHDITAEQRDYLLQCAKVLDQMPVEEAGEPSYQRTDKGDGLRAGDDYNARGTSWRDLMEPKGYLFVTDTLVKRPGKSAPGCSGTAGRCHNKRGDPLYCNFSTNDPYLPGPSGGRNNAPLTRFAVYAYLHHNGNFSAAAKALAAEGFGDQPRRVKMPGNGHANAAVRLLNGHANGQASGNGQTDKTPKADSKPGADSSRTPDDDRKPPMPPGDDIHLTDRGNAQRVIGRHGADLRFCQPMKKFLVFNGTRWQQDESNRTPWLVKETQRDYYHTVAQRIGELADVSIDDEFRKSAMSALQAELKHLLKWEDQRRIDACLASMKSEPGIPIKPDQLDTDGMLLNTLNCTIDLRTGEARPHRREDHLTKITRCAYDAEGPSMLWQSCLDTWMAGNAPLIDYLQRVCGYCLTGDVSEQCLWFFYGEGQNGKSVFTRTIQDILGDYALAGVDDLLMQKKHESHPTERASLFGRRLVLTTEQDQGRKLAEALMKKLTGDDVITARRMKEDFWEFEPTFKIILAANHKPEVQGQDKAVWRRVKLVPWVVTIPDDKKDPKLRQKLKAEWPGILAWMERGCREWQRHGLAEPREITEATNAYRRDQNVIAEFLAERCTLNEMLQVRADPLRIAFEKWHGHDITRNAFAAAMTTNGYTSVSDSSKCKVYKGIGLNSD